MLASELKTSLEVLLIVTNKQTQLSASELAQLSTDIAVGQARGDSY